MKKVDTYLAGIIFLSIAIIAAIAFFIFNMTKGHFGRAALEVKVTDGSANVVLNGKSVGETPFYTENINSNRIELEIDGENNSYSTLIRPAAGTLAFVHRDLGVSDIFSSGMNLWMTKTGGDNRSIFIVSPKVDDVSVIVDGVEIGKAPGRFVEKDFLKSSEDGTYTFVFRKAGYEEQEITLAFENNYELNITLDLFPQPFNQNISPLVNLDLPANVILYDFSPVAMSSDFNDRQHWAKAINYWLQTRRSLTIGNNEVDIISYFYADDGKVYNSQGQEIGPSEIDFLASERVYLAYLGSASLDQMTNESQRSLNITLGLEIDDTAGGTDVQVGDATGGSANVGEVIKRVRITDTGIGFLRVRSGAGTTYSEVGQLEVGAMVNVLEESSGWYRIQYSGASSAWISATYAEDTN